MQQTTWAFAAIHRWWKSLCAWISKVTRWDHWLEHWNAQSLHLGRPTSTPSHPVTIHLSVIDGAIDRFAHCIVHLFIHAPDGGHDFIGLQSDCEVHKRDHSFDGVLLVVISPNSMGWDPAVPDFEERWSFFLDYLPYRPATILVWLTVLFFSLPRSALLGVEHCICILYRGL